MGFLDNLSKSLSSGTERVKFEADKFQRTSKISGDISNLNSQIETNTRQLGERALELYQQGTITAPEVASLAQIIGQLREQRTAKEQELTDAQNAQFEGQPPAAATPSGRQVPIMAEAVDPATTIPAQAMPTVMDSNPVPMSPPPMSDLSDSSTMPSTPSMSGVTPAGTTPYACPTCGYSLPQGAAFCPNCGSKTGT